MRAWMMSSWPSWRSCKRASISSCKREDIEKLRLSVGMSIVSISFLPELIFQRGARNESHDGLYRGDKGNSVTGHVQVAGFREGRQNGSDLPIVAYDHNDFLFRHNREP